jgi:group I intron endonuclease
VAASAGVYEIQHVESGRRYVGSAQNLQRRFAEHRYSLRRNRHRNKALQNGWNKYGEPAFAFRTILICRSEDAIFYEQLVIDGYESHKMATGYNIRKIAESNLGLQWSGETRAAIMAARATPAHKQKQREVGLALRGDPAHAKKMIEGLAAYHKTPESKANAAAQLRRVAADPELLAKREAARLAAITLRRGVKMSEQARRNMSAGGKGKILSAEHRQKLSDAMKRRAPIKHTEATKQRLRELATGRKASQNAREKMSATHRGRKLSPAHVAAILRGRARYYATQKIKKDGDVS